MNPYLAQFRACFRLLLQYRAAALAGFTTQFFWGVLRLSILFAFYASLGAGERPPLEKAGLLSYVWLGQALLGLMPWRPDPEIASMVREGHIAYELTRPIDVYGLWFSRSVAQRVAPTLLRAPLLVISAALIPSAAWALPAPASSVQFLAFLVAACVAVGLVAATATLMAIATLWGDGGNGIAQLLIALLLMTSGLVVPLPLLPDGVRFVLERLPYAGVMDLPLRLYSGNIAASQVWLPLLRGVLWTAVLVGIGRVALTRALGRMVLYGG